MTEKEAAELTALLTQDDVDPLVAGIFGASDEERRKRVVQNRPDALRQRAMARHADLKPLSSNRTSLIYDPPDGKLPPVTPDARDRAAARRANAGFDSYENRPLQERCIIWSPKVLPDAAAALQRRHCRSSRHRTTSWCTGSCRPHRA